jgi:hypothetical protein
MVTVPLQEVAPPAPDKSETMPPVAVEESPPVRAIADPAPLPLLPTDKTMLPAWAAVDCPLRSLRSPENPEPELPD